MGSSYVTPTRTYTLVFPEPLERCLTKLREEIYGVVDVVQVSGEKIRLTISVYVNIEDVLNELETKQKKVDLTLSSYPGDDNGKPFHFQPSYDTSHVVSYKESAGFMDALDRPREFVDNFFAPEYIGGGGAYHYSSSNPDYSLNMAALAQPRDAVHEHNLKLKTYKQCLGKRFSCDKCREDGFGSRYQCNDVGCNYELHLNCKNPNSYIFHELFERSTFILSGPPRIAVTCNACGRTICGHFYHCEEDGLNLHPQCACLKAQIYVSGKCFLLKTRKANNVCLYCKEKEVWATRTWSYEARNDVNYRIHVHCIMQIVQEAWKRIDEEYEDDAWTALGAVAIHNLAVAKKKNWKVDCFWKAISVCIEAIISTVLGNPAPVIASLITELLN